MTIRLNQTTVILGHVVLRGMVPTSRYCLCTACVVGAGRQAS